MKTFMLVFIIATLVSFLGIIGVSSACSRCETYPSGACDGYNQSCGCDPIGSGDCTGNEKQWSVGSHIDCHYVPATTNDYLSCVLGDYIVCYRSQACMTLWASFDEICVGECVWTLLGFCIDCTPVGTSTPHYVWNEKCE
jgi:hypothetical protein